MNTSRRAKTALMGFPEVRPALRPRARVVAMIVFRRQRSRAGAGASSVAPEAPPLSEQLGRKALCERAKDILRPWAEIPFTTMWAPIFTKIGQHEGVGVLLNVIRAIEIGNEAETERTIVRQCDDLVSLASTSMVVSGLALTCSVPLAFQMLSPDPIPLASGTLGGDGWDARGGGVEAAVGWYEGWVTHRSGLHACHWLEIILLGLSAGFNLMCILFCFCTVASTSLYVPTLDSKIWLLVENHVNLQLIWTFPVLGILGLAAAFPFAAVRVSPVATVGAALPVVMLVSSTHLFMPLAHKMAALQHAMARRTLKIEGAGVEKGAT
jgi:hypothetical protein